VKAFTIKEFDVPPGFAEVAEPVAGAGEVRVRLVSSSVNPADWMTAIGGFRAFSDYRLPAVVGRDFAGVVDQVGEGVDGFAVGDEVFGFVKRDYVGDGTFADYVAIPADRYAVHKPADLDFEAAGSAGLAGVTALQCLDASGCGPGDRLLVNGATGGVGAFLVQLASRRGIQILATARPGAESAHVRALGATADVDWSAGDVAAQVRALHPDGVDGVVDLVARSTDQLTALAEGVLRLGGTSVSTLSAAPRVAAGAAAAAQDDLRYVNVHSSGDVDLLHRLVDELADGLRVPVVESYDFDDLDKAFEALSHGPLGKVGIRFEDGDR
jgi:NADPH:quinone reductase-like Zn-dependent oxidoreductase